MSNAADGSPHPSREGAGIRGMVRIPFSDLRDKSPPDLTALYAEVRAGEALIPGLRTGIGAVTVRRWDPAYAADGWTLDGADLTLDMGHPFGALFCRNSADGRVLRIGVRWDPRVQQLTFVGLNPSKPEPNSDCNEGDNAVMLNAGSRIRTLVAVNAEIGSFVATKESGNAIGA